MSSTKIEDLVTELFRTNQNIQKICLLNSDGSFSHFLTRIDVDDGEKKRLAASIMASVVLAERSIFNLVQENVNQVVIKSENNITLIFTTKQNNYLYVLADNDFDYKTILKIDFNF